MATYRYTADDPEGRRVAGHLEASSVEEAVRRLEEQGLQVLEVMETEAPSYAAAPQGRLSSDEAEQFAESVAQLSAAGLPLGPGLRAAAEESDNPRLAAALGYLADRLDEGRPLEDVLESSRDFLPAYVGGLIRAAARTSQVGVALAELVEQYREIGLLRRNILRGMAYPLVVAGMAVVVLVFIVVFVAGGFEQIFADFDMELPMLTKAFFWWRHFGLRILAPVLALAVLAAAVVRWRLGPAAWHRWLATAPLLGPLWHWLGLLEWLGLVRVLVCHGVTLLEALRLSADGLSNANISRVSLSLAEGVARGRSLWQLIALQRQIPASIVPLVKWGEQAGSLAESLGLGRQMLEERIRMRSLWIQAAWPPILFIAIGCCVLLVVGSLFLPLISLVNCLA